MRKCPKCGGEYPDTTTLCPADGIALENTGDSLIGQTLIGKYRIDERLNEGGMGAVYRGTHVLMDKTVAIKVLRPSLAADQKIVARFSREARAASRISHPHALSVTDFGESEDGVVFLVMEYLSGTTLKETIRKDGPMRLDRVVKIVRQVGGALDAAHEQGVVHRDLKSENIMFLATNGPEYAKVLDFGIAKIKEPEDGFDPGLTAPDLVIGTPQYMSPEQCSQSPDIDARSDIYSLGIIIYEMLVGHVPFTGESPTAIMLKHLQEPPPSVLKERPDLPDTVDRILSRAMAKRPEDRYQSVGDLVDDLAVAEGTEAIGIHARATSTEPGVSTQAGAGAIVDDIDEETVVRPRIDIGAGGRTVRRTTEMYPTTPARSLNLWKILIPSLAALLVVFAVVYAFTKSSEPTNNQFQPGLVADPNSQAVEPSPPATGSGEAGIPSGGAVTNPAANSNVNANANANVNAEETFTPDVNLNNNTNTATSQNSNANSNRSTADVPLPTPSRQVNANQQVPPPGTPTPEPKPSTSPSIEESTPL
jgi:eukaryotic-like serine/threonine-protein kinase